MTTFLLGRISWSSSYPPSSRASHLHASPATRSLALLGLLDPVSAGCSSGRWNAGNSRSTPSSGMGSAPRARRSSWMRLTRAARSSSEQLVSDRSSPVPRAGIPASCPRSTAFGAVFASSGVLARATCCGRACCCCCCCCCWVSARGVIVGVAPLPPSPVVQCSGPGLLPARPWRFARPGGPAARSAGASGAAAGSAGRTSAPRPVPR
mmetsp:Transcript_107208/g.320627  ORF Transcript_107208/g.320627 Transcript_107208/m.320627 type:complete len:208 (+) Transcript_107208:479-1102(+)